MAQAHRLQGLQLTAHEGCAKMRSGVTK